MQILYCTHTAISTSETFLRKTLTFLDDKFETTLISTARHDGSVFHCPSHFLDLQDAKIKDRFLSNFRALIERKSIEQVRLESHAKRVRTFFLKKNILAQAAVIEYGTSAVVFAPILQEKKIPFVITLHGYDCSAYLGFRWYRNRLREFCNDAVAVIVPSNHLRRRLQLIGIKPSVIAVEPCAPTYHALPSLCSTSEPRVVAIGRMTEKKCPQALLYSAQIILRKFPKTTFHIIGDGPLFEEIQKLKFSLGLNQQMKLYGALNHKEALEILATGTVFYQHSVTSSTGDQEGFPVAIAEAAALGVPVVSTRHSGICEEIVHGKTGFLVEEHDYESMAQFVTLLLSDDSLRAKLSMAARNHIMNVAGPFSREEKITELLKTNCSPVKNESDVVTEAPNYQVTGSH